MQRTPTLRRSTSSAAATTKRRLVVHNTDLAKPLRSIESVTAIPRTHSTVFSSGLPNISEDSRTRETETKSSVAEADYLQHLSGVFSAARDAHDQWLGVIVESRNSQQASNEEVKRLIREEQERQASEAQERYEESRRREEDVRRERIAAAAEAQRLEAETQRRLRDERLRLTRLEHERLVQEAIESRRLEEERQRLEREELEHARREGLRLARLEQERLIREANEARRVEEERQRLEREEMERARREAAAAAEERRREEEAAQRDCAVCMDRMHMRGMAETPCSHWYCHGCLNEAIQVAFRSKQLFQCCGQTVPPAQIRDLLGGGRIWEDYDLLAQELSTPNPIYCSNPRCSLFLPSSQASGPDLMICHQCSTRTCRHCRNRSHSGICPSDTGVQQARELASRLNWMACSRCNNMVEKSEGCLHMTCRCGYEFCYRCGHRWRLSHACHG